MTAEELDPRFMAEALDQARLGWGRTSPNPMVGAVVVKDGIIVGRGYHHGAGLPHAEPNALRDAGEACQGSTLYVTLEPCCTTGRTPPCTDAIKKAGISRVVIGCLDPNPKHAGRALDILAQAGIETRYGVLEKECQDLNRGFFSWITTGKPWVILKMAMTLDGKIATAGGDSKWVTGALSRQRVQVYRQLADAIMVGGETARLDRPSLQVREPQDWPCQPKRLIWTSRDLPEDSPLKTDGGPRPECCKPTTAAEWDQFLKHLGEDGIMNLLLEGGGELAGQALQAGIVDEIAFFIAPKLLGGRGSRPVVAGDNPTALAQALPIQNVTLEWLGEDLLYRGLMPHGQRE